MFRTNNIKGTPIENSKSTPLALSAQLGRCNQHVSPEQIVELAIEKYKSKDGSSVKWQN
jgi:hypothetical protein